MNYSYQKRFSWPLVLFVLVLGVILFGLSFRFITKARRQGNLVQAGSSAKAITGGLNSFRQEYGIYPCDASRVLLAQKGLTNLPPGKSANAYLAQLIITGMVYSETYYDTPEVEGIHRGDDIKNTPETILAQGENGFAYIMTTGGRPLSGDISILPVIIAPIRGRGPLPVFDTEIYGGKYVYGAIDGSSKQGNLDEDGIAMSKGRAHLFETGSNSLFGGEAPVIAYPLGF